ncbi:hypothetical protein TB1_001008 [Malus domestica]
MRWEIKEGDAALAVACGGGWPRLCWTLVVIDGRISALAESNGIVSVVIWRSNESLSSAAPLSLEPETQKALNSSRQNEVIVVGVVIDHDALEL